MAVKFQGGQAVAANPVKAAAMDIVDKGQEQKVYEIGRELRFMKDFFMKNHPGGLFKTSQYILNIMEATRGITHAPTKNTLDRFAQELSDSEDAVKDAIRAYEAKVKSMIGKWETVEEAVRLMK